MKNYIVYNSNGDILRTGSCPESMMEIQAQEDEFVIEGQADDVCDQIDIKTKKVMKDYKISRQAIEEAEERKRIEEAPAKAKEVLIKNKMEQIVRQMAMDELKKEGKI